MAWKRIFNKQNEYKNVNMKNKHKIWKQHTYWTTWEVDWVWFFGMVDGDILEMTVANGRYKANNITLVKESKNTCTRNACIFRFLFSIIFTKNYK